MKNLYIHKESLFGIDYSQIVYYFENTVREDVTEDGICYPHIIIFFLV